MGAALAQHGWTVHISDAKDDIAAEAVSRGVAHEVGVYREADVTIVATPVGQVVPVVEHILTKVDGPVTDVGSTKADICSAIDSPRFVGGHPMAGSEMDGLSGARPDLFAGAIWVLTPSKLTDESAVLAVRSVVSLFDSDILMLPPSVHDRIVAKVSHVPHLAAATLMNLADKSAVDHQVLLRMAAGGFRDMTRISAGQPTIWPDICLSNKTAIVDGLTQLIDSLSAVRENIQNEDAPTLISILEQARNARLNLPIGFDEADSLTEISILISDEPGQIAAVSNLAAENDINLYDLEISHSAEGQRGVMILIVASDDHLRLEELLLEVGYSSRSRPIG